MKPYAFEHVDVEISGGQDISRKARSYTQTQFGLGTTAAAAEPILVGTPGDVFTDANILDPAQRLRAHRPAASAPRATSRRKRSTRRYVKADALVNDSWRFAGGVR